MFQSFVSLEVAGAQLMKLWSFPASPRPRQTLQQMLEFAPSCCFGLICRGGPVIFPYTNRMSVTRLSLIWPVYICLCLSCANTCCSAFCLKYLRGRQDVLADSFSSFSSFSRQGRQFTECGWFFSTQVVDSRSRGSILAHVESWFNRRKFTSQTSDNMDRWKAEQGRGREKRKIEERRVEEKE